MHLFRTLPRLAALLCLSAAAALAQKTPILLNVDATDATRNILHARLQIPVSPGPLTLFYPKWIPGDHAPTGPITDLVGLKFSSAGQPLTWHRDAEDMYALNLEVPVGATTVDVALDYLIPSESDVTPKMLVLPWNRVLLYPKGLKADEIRVSASLRLPPDWKFATALQPTVGSDGDLHFAPVSLETLVDSPVLAGRFFSTVDLTPGKPIPHLLHIVADSPASLELKPEEKAALSRLVAEEEDLFGCSHYRDYHFLLALSDHIAHYGLEHHESSENRVAEEYLTDDDAWKFDGPLLPHEMAHSWNGKYRRPAGLATPDFQKPMDGELLWVYEGLTDYLGEILTARSGIWTNEAFREDFAFLAALLDHRSGREWRPLADTATAAQVLYGSRPEGRALRRGTDFYEEGDLIWLEADVIIRQQTHGKRSLDDFCKRFHGGENGPPKVVPYSYEDVLTALNAVAPYDWRQFFQKRVYEINPHAPVGGIEASGWRLAYTNTIPEMYKIQEAKRKTTDLSFSLGVRIKADGTVLDVIPGSPASQAQLGPDSKLIAVNNRKWTPEVLRTAIKTAATNAAPIELLVESADYFKTCKIDYHDGEKYPCLQRDPSKPDLLSEIIKPLTRR